MQAEFPALQCFAEIGFQRQQMHGLGMHRRVEHFIATLARELGAVHSSVGVAQQLFRAARLARAHGDADAGGRVDFLPVEFEGHR